jgi:hypothetical protein
LGNVFLKNHNISLRIGKFSFYKPLNILNNTIINSKLHNFALNTTTDPTLPTLCVVTRIYWAQLQYFSVFALALYHTGLHNVRIYLINTDNQTNIQQLEETVQFINQLVLRKDFVVLLDLGEPSNGQDFGYPMTDRALAYLYRQHVNSSSICQYFTFTNADNFYSRNFAKKILPHMKAEKDIIAWGFVSHHRKVHYQELIDATIKTVPEIVDDGTQKCTPVKFIPGYVDLGAVAYRLSFLQKHNLYFRPPDGSYHYGSDGYFAEQAARRTTTSIILRQTLFMHQ